MRFARRALFGCALLVAGLALTGCDAPAPQQSAQAVARKEDSRFGPWQTDGLPDLFEPPAATTPQQGPNREIVEFLADLDKACQSVRKDSAPSEIASGTLVPASIIGRLTTSKGLSCAIRYDERSTSDLVSGGRSQSLRGVSPAFATGRPEEARALLCVDESGTRIGTYVAEKAPAGTGQMHAYQLVWDARLISWPSRRVLARRELKGDVPPPRIYGGSNVCGNRPAVALNQWLQGGAEKLPQGCDARISHRFGGLSLAISPDGKVLVSASGDGAIKLWSLPDGTLRKKLATQRRETMVLRTTLAISPNGKLLASAMSDHRIQLWTLPDGEPLNSFAVGERGSIHTLAFGADSTYLASGEDGFGGIKLWSVPQGKLLKAVPTVPKESPNLAMAMSGDGKLLASGGYDKTVTVRELPKGSAKFLRGHKNWVQALALNSDGRLAASANEYDGLKLWSLPDGKEISTLPAGNTRALAFEPNGGRLVSASAILKIWAADGTLVKSLWGHGQPRSGNRPELDAVAISPDGRLLASAGNHSIRLWSLPEGRIQACLADPEP